MNKLLIIDDSRAALKALCMQLDPNLFAIATAQSAAEGLKSLEEQLPDCILTDYEMPEVNGPGLCRIVKTHEKFKHIPIIVLTSMTETAHILEAIEAGANDFVSKDSDMRVIIAKILGMIRFKKTQDELLQLRRVAGIKQIVATYNHEFNNPLAIAIGNLSFLRTSITDPQQLHRVQRAYEALERMAGLVRKIRDLRDYVEQNYSTTETMLTLNPTA